MKLEIEIKDEDCLEAWKEAKKNLKKFKKFFTPKVLKKLKNGDEWGVDSFTEKQAIDYFDTIAALFLIFVANDVKETDSNSKKPVRKRQTNHKRIKKENLLGCDDVALHSYWNR